MFPPVLATSLLFIQPLLCEDIVASISDIAVNEFTNALLNIFDTSDLSIPAGEAPISDGIQYIVLYPQIEFDSLVIDCTTVNFNEAKQEIYVELYNVSLSLPQFRLNISDFSCYAIIPYLRFTNWDFHAVINLYNKLQSNTCNLPISVEDSSIYHNDNGNELDYHPKLEGGWGNICSWLSWIVHQFIDIFFIDDILQRVFSMALIEIMNISMSYAETPTFDNYTLAQLCWTNASVTNDKLSFASNLIVDEKWIFNRTDEDNNNNEYTGIDMYQFGLNEGIKYQKQMEIVWIIIVSVSLFVTVLLISCICCLCRRCKKHRNNDISEQNKTNSLLTIVK